MFLSMEDAVEAELSTSPPLPPDKAGKVRTAVAHLVKCAASPPLTVSRKGLPWHPPGKLHAVGVRAAV